MGLAIALTWLGPRSSEGLGTLNALAFWLAHVGIGLVILALVQLVIGRSAWVSKRSPVAQVFLGGVCAAVVFIPVAVGLDLIFEAPEAADEIDGNLGMELVMEFVQVLVPFVLIWLLINAPSLVKLEREDGQEVDAATADPTTEFWSKVPKALGRDLIALSAELHYLRVYTSAGDTLILFAFGRAIELLDDAASCQIHRSHWVRFAHIDALEPSDGNLICAMDTGLQLPVSRRYRKAVKLGFSR